MALERDCGSWMGLRPLSGNFCAALKRNCGPWTELRLLSGNSCAALERNRVKIENLNFSFFTHSKAAPLKSRISRNCGSWTGNLLAALMRGETVGVAKVSTFENLRVSGLESEKVETFETSEKYMENCTFLQAF